MIFLCPPLHLPLSRDRVIVDERRLRFQDQTGEVRKFEACLLILSVPSIIMTTQSPKEEGNDSRFPDLYNDFGRSCQTNKGFIASRLLWSPCFEGTEGGPLASCAMKVFFSKGGQIESVFNSPSPIWCKAVLNNPNRSTSRSFEESAGRRRHLSLTQPLLSMICRNFFSISTGSTFLK